MTTNLAPFHSAIEKMRWAPRQTLFFILAYVSLIQGILFFYDLAHPEIFLHADRAWDRMKAINDLVSFFRGNSSLAQFLAYQGTLQGVPGDYLIQGLFFYLGGQYAVVLFQIVLFIASIAALYGLTLLLTHSVKTSAATTLIYAHLPYGMVFPHMLWSEALSNPFTLFSFYFVARCVIRNPSWVNVACAALFLGAATLVRPTTVLWPIAVVATFVLCGLSVKKTIGYVAILVVVLIGWSSFVWSQTGNFRMTGNVSGGVAHSADDLSTRMQFMIDTLPMEQRAAAEQRFLIPQDSKRSLPAVIYRYVIFGFTHPAPFAQQLAHDAVIFVAQSGIERFTIDYLGLAGDDRTSIQSVQSGWRKKLIDEGFIATGLMFLRDHGVILISSLVGLVAILVLWTFAGLGTIAVLRKGTETFAPNERIVLLSMALFVFYVFVPGQLFYYPQARYRSPAEFCLSILAVIGWQAAMTFLRRSRTTQNFPVGTANVSR